MLYLYGIIDGRQTPEPMPAGLEDRASCIVPYDDLAAVAGWLQRGRPPASEANLRKHFNVLEAFMASHTVLPARFGSTFADLEELTAHLAFSRNTYTGDLRRLRGQIELGVRAGWHAAPMGPSDASMVFAATGSGPGACYLAEKRAKAAYCLDRQREAQDLASIISAPLALHATQAVWRPLRGNLEKAAISMAFLLSKERLGGFREALVALRRSKPDLDILCTGPWPPYSFISAFDQTAEAKQFQGAFQCGT